MAHDANDDGAAQSATFESLGVANFLVKQCNMLSMTRPTEVQRACIPLVLAGKQHVVAGAATGSGKTAAFALPILQALAQEMYGVFGLVMTPSRELAYQIIDQFVAFGAPMGLRNVIVIGGVPHGKQFEALVARPHIAVATPGRLRMLLESFPEVQQAFRNLRYLVLDEADRLTEGDMREDTLAVAEALGEPKSFRRSLFFSATVNTELTDVAEGLLGKFGVATQESLSVVCTSSELLQAERSIRTVAPNLSQQFLFVPLHVKMQYLVVLLRSRDKSQSAIIFVNSCVRCEVVRLTLQLLGFPVTSLNSLLNQKQRLNNLAMFKAGIAKFLIATDIAARGLDIPEVALVVHYDFPKISSTYVHRVGRTARAGRSGDSVAIVTDGEVYLVHKVERRTKSKMTRFSNPAVSEKAVLSILDDVSGAKVEARLTVKRDFGDRAEDNKEVAAERRSEMNRAIRQDGRSLQQPRRERVPTSQKESSKHGAEADVGSAPPAAPNASGKKRAPKAAVSEARVKKQAAAEKVVEKAAAVVGGKRRSGKAVRAAE